MLKQHNQSPVGITPCVVLQLNITIHLQRCLQREWHRLCSCTCCIPHWHWWLILTALHGWPKWHHMTRVQVCIRVFICKSFFNKNFRIKLKSCRSKIKVNNNLLLFIKCILFSFIHFAIRNNLCLFFILSSFKWTKYSFEFHQTVRITD